MRANNRYTAPDRLFGPGYPSVRAAAARSPVSPPYGSVVGMLQPESDITLVWAHEVQGLVRAAAGQDLNGPDVAGDDRFETDLNLHPEPDIDPAQFQKGAPERAARDVGARGLREEASALHQHLPAQRVQQNHPIEAVACLDSEFVQLSQTINL
jgi:hypothetical protein